MTSPTVQTLKGLVPDRRWRRFSSVAALAVIVMTLLVVIGRGDPASSASAIDFRGYYAMYSGPITRDLREDIQSPLVAGLSLRTRWEQLAPDYGTYDWSLIDQALDGAEGKPVMVRVFFGRAEELPPWLFTTHGGMPAVEKFIFGNGAIPAFWDETLHRDWREFLNAFKARYAGADNVILHVTGPWKHWGEPFLPACTDQDEARWVQAYSAHLGRAATFEEVRDAYDEFVLDELMPAVSGAVPGQPIAMAAGLGLCDTDSDPRLDDRDAAYHPHLRDQFLTGRQRYGSFHSDTQRGFFVQFNGLNGSMDGPSKLTGWVGENFNPVDGAAHRGTIGYQMIGCVSGLCDGGQLVTPAVFSTAIDNAVAYHASYVEVQSDVLHAAIDPDTSKDPAVARVARAVLVRNQPELISTLPPGSEPATTTTTTTTTKPPATTTTTTTTTKPPATTQPPPTTQPPVTTEPPDVTPPPEEPPPVDAPAPPANLQLVGVTDNAVLLSWTPVMDAQVIGYRLDVNGVGIGMTPQGGAMWLFSGLRAGTRYTFDIRTVEADGTMSTKATIAVTTNGACFDFFCP